MKVIKFFYQSTDTGEQVFDWIDLFGFLQVDFALQCPVEDMPSTKEQLNGQEHRVSL